MLGGALAGWACGKYPRGRRSPRETALFGNMSRNSARCGSHGIEIRKVQGPVPVVVHYSSVAESSARRRHGWLASYNLPVDGAGYRFSGSPGRRLGDSGLGGWAAIAMVKREGGRGPLRERDLLLVPVKAVEANFAVDSTGFSTSRFIRVSSCSTASARLPGH